MKAVAAGFNLRCFLLSFQERAGKECLSERHFGAFPLEESPPLNFPSFPFRRGRKRLMGGGF